MCTDILQKLDEIYRNIFTWIKSCDPEYESKVFNLMETFLNDNIDIEKFYKHSYQILVSGLNEANQLLHALNTISSKKVKYMISKDMLKYIYLDIQKEVFLYNTILNKALFPLRFEKLFEDISANSDISKLDLLEYLDTSTAFKYTNRSRSVNLNFSENQTIMNRFIAQLSLQKNGKRSIMK